MNTEQIIKLAIEAGLQWYAAPEGGDSTLVKFATLATQAERTARQAAQAENEQLKAQLARSGVELRKAVLAEREACAKACDARYMGDNSREDMEARNCARDIRSLNLLVGANKLVPGLALESGEFVPAEKMTDWSAA